MVKYLCKVSGIYPNLSNLAQFQIIGIVEILDDGIIGKVKFTSTFSL